MDVYVCGNLGCLYFGKVVPTRDNKTCCFCEQRLIAIYDAALRRGEEADRQHAEAMKDYGGD